MVKIFKSTFLGLQDEKSLESLLLEISPSLSLKPTKAASSKTQYPKLHVKIDLDRNLPLQDEIFSLLSLKKEVENNERVSIEVEILLFQKF